MTGHVSFYGRFGHSLCLVMKEIYEKSVRWTEKGGEPRKKPYPLLKLCKIIVVYAVFMGIRNKTSPLRVKATPVMIMKAPAARATWIRPKAVTAR
jgi:hypothetical protein